MSLSTCRYDAQRPSADAHSSGRITELHFHNLRCEALNRLDILELSAISDHKMLSMLKRYVHLKTEEQVKKLDNRSP
ncbi:hypothetical protein BFS14_15110 [Serratia fonticola]|nr:hypothetical protein BFS14_15110 [Serratia fonticola]